ncbi:hypothetical protein M2480_002047 [Parabacteroides sp. PFB2-12]|uniref:hypothetical protein n=1 Tax=unclassified Parabacteroides TaxID=2649774 RepID=UPI002476047C|nr:MULTISPECIES: hypothetical protein [unclassified Parabacteroides]MDH6342927.1 hypothetical protein [Parabacteroides sp. PM6-13]MDH6391058.1 hypothetical protein [Parabacteroides sp. PFB2-12]
MKKGQTNNPNGRPKGVPNKITGELKSWIQQVIDGNRVQFEKDLKELDPKDRVQVLEKLMQYVVPKQQSVSVDAQIACEYKELEKLLLSAPDEVVDRLAERIQTLNNLNHED